MNSIIETLNQFGAQLLHFAWPMLWQSSLLIAFIFALDFLLARKIRASVRYALWLVVLVKLLLPPTLALPTGATWWLVHAPPTVKAPAIKNYTITYDTTPLADYIPPAVALPPPAPPRLTGAGWALLASGAVSVGLLLWLVFRWWQVTRMVRRAIISEELADLIETVQQQTGLRSRVRLKLIEGRMSPAVCGLSRPVILLPRMLAEQLLPAQLRAVLLHEAFHLRRKDVWVNCAQALLQIIYWWHPLLWVANARIRRVREEAVDDAVMLALRDEAETYAPTLLEVAKLAFRRPLMSLGLVGIMESRSALRQRIERLVDFRAPRKAGLTFVSLCGICVFSAVALPMGEGPSSPNSTSEKDLRPTTAIVTSVSSTPTNNPAILIQAEIYRMRQVDFEKLDSNPAATSSLQDKLRLLKASGLQPISRPRIQTRNNLPVQFYIDNKTNSIEFKCLPIVINGKIDLTSRIKIISTAGTMTTNEFIGHRLLISGSEQVFSIRQKNGWSESNIVVTAIRAEILTNLPDSDGKVLDPQSMVQDGKLFYEMGKLDDAEKKLNAALALDPENAAAKYYLNLIGQARNAPRSRGINRPYVRGSIASREGIIYRLDTIRLDQFGYDAAPLEIVEQDLGQAIGERDAEKLGIGFMQSPDLNSVLVTIKPALTNVLARDALAAIVTGASKPIKYSILEEGVEFSWKNQTTSPLYSRHFRVSTNLFTTAWRNAAGMQTNSVSQMAGSYFRSLGVDLQMPGKSIFYNDRLGELFVRATQDDLDKVENALGRLNSGSVPIQIHIKARFVEAPKGILQGIKTMASVIHPPGQTNQLAVLTGILTSENFQTVWRNLKNQPGVEVLAEPEVVTTSGRQTQMRATTVISVITNLTFQEISTNQNGLVVSDSIAPQSSRVETGPVLDVVPYVLADGCTINLTVIPSLTEFLGYGNTTNATTAYSRSGEKIDVPVILPNFRLQQVVATLNLWDNQTVIIGGLPEKDYFTGKEAVGKSKASDKELLVFITATIVDPVGNRVHSDEELPFAKNGIPPQPAPLK